MVRTFERDQPGFMNRAREDVNGSNPADPT